MGRCANSGAVRIAVRSSDKVNRVTEARVVRSHVQFRWGEAGNCMMHHDECLMLALA